MGCMWYQNADLNLRFKDSSFPYGSGESLWLKEQREQRAFFFRVSGIMSIHLFFFYITFFYLYVLSTYLIGLIFFFLSEMTISAWMCDTSGLGTLKIS